MAKCNHTVRSAKGDAALVDSGIILNDIVPEFRSRYPDDTRTDEELVESFRQVLMNIPRHCPICTGGAD